MNGTVEVAGPERFRLDELIRRSLSARNHPREVVADTQARYFGATLSENTLVPVGEAELGETRFEDWLGRTPLSVPTPRPAAAAAAIEPSTLKDKHYRG